MKIAVAATMLLAASSALAAGTPNLTGKWTIHNSIMGNESDVACNIVQVDAKLSGSCKSADKDAPITGSVDGDKATWKYDSDHEGSTITLTYTATVSDGGKFSGSVGVDPYGVSGDFTATLLKEASK